MVISRTCVLLACMAAAVPSGTLIAQATTGTIYGNVADSSGLAVTGANIKVTNVATNVARNTTSGPDGSFTLPFVPIGTYRVEVESPGFKKFEQTGLELDLDRNARVSAILEIGQLTETVQVTGDAPLVETKAPALGVTIQNKEIDDLPLVDRDLYSLLTLTPGVDMTAEANDFGTPGRVTLVNGSPHSGIGGVNYNLDGGTNMSGLRNTGNPAPNPDAVEQFRVITNGYPAQYGRFPSGVVDIVTKSGTNQVHGTLFEFIRNDKLNANRWLPGQAALRKDPLHRNQFGGSVGGPILKNRTFYFFSYSGLRQRQSYYDNTATPLTAAERVGDLSASGGTAPVDPDNNNQPFPNRQIPVSRFDVAAKTIMEKYVPLPNLRATPSGPLSLYEVQLPHPKDQNDETLKLDHTLSSAHRLTASWLRNTGEDLSGLIGNLPWVQRDFIWTHNAINASETWVVSPTKINDFHLQYQRSFGGRVNLPAISLGDLGSKYRIQGAPSLPQIRVSGRFNMDSAIPGPVAGDNLYELRDTLNINHGRHSISVGGQVLLTKMILDTQLNNYGVFSFSSSTGSRTRNATADYLLGLPVSMKQDTPVVKVNNSWYYGLFFQDDFRILPRLTLNLGLRYDLQMPITDTHDRYLTFIPGRQSTKVPNAPLGVVFAGEQGIPRAIIDPDLNNFSPRLGIAWDPFGNGRTSVRGAFGIFSGSLGGNPIDASTDTQPFSVRQTFNNVKSLADPYGFLPGGQSPFPYIYTPGNARFLYPANVQGISQDLRSPYSYQMNFSIQRQVAKDMSFMVAYNSTLVHKIPVGVDINNPIYRPGATTSNIDDRRPYLPGVLSSIGILKGILNSSYHGVQITGEKRYARNFQVRGFLTIGKGIDAMNTQNSTGQTPTDWNNISLDRGRATNDRKYTFTMAGSWDLNYFQHTPQFVRAVAGGWSVSFIGTARSGLPMSISSGVDSNLDGTTDRADILGDPRLDPNRPRSEVVAMWFDPKVFARPKDGTVGNSSRNFLDGPGMKSVDLSIRRAFRITEGKVLEFRGDATNAFNMVNLSNPGNSINSSSNVGRITTAAPMRQAQLGLKLKF
jgi:Carboxypeptidase regulatory-like domain/TonB dependent receptor